MSNERKVKLEIKDMTKLYDNGDGVRHINLEIYEGEIVTFLGPSGCGKTTILRTIGGFLDVTEGDITVDGQSIIHLPPEKRPTAMVFQSYNLWPHMTIYENLAFGLKLRKVPKAEIDKAVKDGLALVSMKRRTEGIRVPVPLAWEGSSTARALLRLCPESACQTGPSLELSSRLEVG